MEKRRCLGVSSCTGGDSGRLKGSSSQGRSVAAGIVAGKAFVSAEEPSPLPFLLSESRSSSPALSSDGRALSLEEPGRRRDSARDFRGAADCLDGRVAAPDPEPVPGSRTVCRRMSVSLAMMPRRRRKGMVRLGGEVAKAVRFSTWTTGIK